MKRFTICLLAALMAAVLLLPVSAQAMAGAPAESQAAAYSGEVRYCTAYQARLLYRMVDDANRTVEYMVKQAQRTPYNDVWWLLIKVQLVTAPVFLYAERIGAVVVCEYVEYYIDGQYVMVDPLRVVRVNVGSGE